MLIVKCMKLQRCPTAGEVARWHTLCHADDRINQSTTQLLSWKPEETNTKETFQTSAVSCSWDVLQGSQLWGLEAAASDSQEIRISLSDPETDVLLWAGSL